MKFFRGKKDDNFIVWVCPLLKPHILIEGMTVFKEEDEIRAIYFLEKGKAAYVLERQQNYQYKVIEQGDHFGTSDIMFRHIQYVKIKGKGDFERHLQ